LLQFDSLTLQRVTDNITPYTRARTPHAYSFGQFDRLPRSFGQLSTLVHLGMGWSRSLTALPESFGELAALASLDLRWCPALTALPESFGHLGTLTRLDVAYCRALMALPESFGNLASLTDLDMLACKHQHPAQVIWQADSIDRP
jgi:hypothetical protein